MAIQDFTYTTVCPICRKSGKQLFSRDLTSGPTLDSLLARARGDVDASYYHGVKYELYHCPRCNHYYQSYLPHAASAQGHSAHVADDSIELRSHINLGKRNIREVEMIAPLLGKSPNEITLLEFGTGWGFWLRMAAAYDYRTLGVEILPDRAAFLRQHNLTVVPTLDDVSGPFDFIYSDQVIEHMNDPVAVMKKIADLLKPDGIIHISVPNGDLAKKYFLTVPLVKAIYPFEHVQCFTHHSLVRLAAAVGLEPVPTSHILRSLVGAITISKNLHFLQEAIKIIRRQHVATNIYFRKARTV